MVLVKKGRLFRRKDGKYLLYIPLDLAQDSAFPFKIDETTNSLKVMVTIDKAQKLLFITEA